jgi:hypothetical protein
MAQGPARPGPRDGSGPLVWAIGGACAALIVLVVRLSLASETRDQAFVYVLVGVLGGFLLHLMLRRRRRGKDQR